MLAGGCLADQARELEYEYCGPDAGRCFVDHLNTIHDPLTGLLKTHFWKHHNKQMAVIETQKCSCQYTLQHRPWCKETTSTDQPCRCGHCRQHKKGCKYIVTKCLIMKEYLSIPILGYNSGKYDLTFIITHMQKYDISPPITKTNSYMKLEYGAYAFLDAHNYVPPTCFALFILHLSFCSLTSISPLCCLSACLMILQSVIVLPIAVISCT
jgi:hypothetical protein